MPTWRQNDFDEAFGELILWSQVQVLVGPPLKKLLIQVAFFLPFSCRYTHLKAVFPSETAHLTFKSRKTILICFQQEKTG